MVTITHFPYYNPFFPFFHLSPSHFSPLNLVRVSGRLSRTTDPPLCGRHRRRVNHKAVMCAVKNGRRFEARHVRAVAELGHGEAAEKVLQSQHALLDEGAELLRGGLAADSAKEEAVLIGC